MSHTCSRQVIIDLCCRSSFRLREYDPTSPELGPLTRTARTGFIYTPKVLCEVARQESPRKSRAHSFRRSARRSKSLSMSSCLLAVDDLAYAACGQRIPLLEEGRFVVLHFRRGRRHKRPWAVPARPGSLAVRGCAGCAWLVPKLSRQLRAKASFTSLVSLTAHLLCSTMRWCCGLPTLPQAVRSSRNFLLVWS